MLGIIVFIVFYIGAVISSAVFMYLHNGRIIEAAFLALAVAFGLGFMGLGFWTIYKDFC